MTEAKDLKLEISTEGARSLLEIGCDIGINAAANFGIMSGAFDEAAAEFMIKNAANPFRRASTVIECAKCKHSLAADGRCHSIGCECDCDNSDTARLPSDVVKQLERVEADAEANTRAHERATACTCSFPVISMEHQNYCPRSKAHVAGSGGSGGLGMRCRGTCWTQDGNERCRLIAGHEGPHRA